MQNRYFRAGVGTIIYNQDGQLAFFKRAYHPVGVWQFQQGGIDAGESIETTLWRELEEEVGLTDDDIEKVIEYSRWTVYGYTDEMIDNSPEPDRLGQAHRWFFLKLKSDSVIDLTKAHDEEFSEWKWITFEEAIGHTNDLKKHVYEELQEFYTNSVLK